MLCQSYSFDYIKRQKLEIWRVKVIKHIRNCQAACKCLLIPAFTKQKQVDLCEFEVSLVFIEFQANMATYKDPVEEKKKPKDTLVVLQRIRAPTWQPTTICNTSSRRPSVLGAFTDQTHRKYAFLLRYNYFGICLLSPFLL